MTLMDTSVPYAYAGNFQEGSIGTTARFNNILATAKVSHESSSYAYTPSTVFDLDVPGEMVTSSTDRVGNQAALWRVGNDTWLCGSYGPSTNLLSLSGMTDDPNGREEIERLVDKIISNVSPMTQPPKDTVRVKFTYWQGEKSTFQNRDLRMQPWESIENNYASSAQRDMGQLMAVQPDDIGNARILVMHGPPGTGKTTAIRSLANAWRGWCDSTYIIDPEQMFSRATYLIEVMIGMNNDRWQLVIIEDAEEFLTPDAKHSVGQNLARLLNLGDGMMGQGLKMMILMTTNVPIAKMHKAITRPGRCLANIEVPALSAAESKVWSGGKVSKEATLAELYEATNLSQIGTGISGGSGVGTYL